MQSSYQEINKKRKRNIDESQPNEEDYPTDVDESDAESVYESESELESDDNLSSTQKYKVIKNKNKNNSFNPSILTITSHGNILLDNHKNYIFTEIPDGIELIKISISAPGVVHYSNNKNLNRNLVEIIKSIPSLLNPNLDENMLNNLVRRILNYVEKHTVSQVINKKLNKSIYTFYHLKHIFNYPKSIFLDPNLL